MRATAFLIGLLSLPAFAGEHVLIRPYPGSVVGGHEERQDQKVSLPAGPGKTLDLQGRVSRYVWKNPKGVPLAQIGDAYAGELRRDGFDALWDCAGTACGAPRAAGPLGRVPAGAEARYLLGQMVRRELGDAFVALQVAKGETTLAVVEVNATPEQRDEAVKAVVAAASRVTPQALRQALSQDGHVALGDILYKPGEVALRPEAAGVVKAIATLLHDQPGLSLYVVGHTDAQGQLATNVAISKRRAQWLVRALEKQGVPAARLRAEGVGPLAPVAPNDTAEGRSKNRRVELVPR